MSVLNLISERYDREARLYPALLLIAPVVATAMALVGSQLTVLHSVGALLAGAGGAFLLAQLARDRGKKLESSLFHKWGGLPSVAIFRHRNSTLDAITKARYHKTLATLVKGAKAPSIEAELADPAAADTVYAAWSHFLRTNAQGESKKHPLILKENISYGYRRNVCGLRPIGIGLTLLCTLVSACSQWANYLDFGEFRGSLVGVLVLSLLLLMLWIFRFKEEWVRIPAEAYALRLAESVESLEAKQRKLMGAKTK